MERVKVPWKKISVCCTKRVLVGGTLMVLYAFGALLLYQGYKAQVLPGGVGGPQGECGEEGLKVEWRGGPRPRSGTKKKTILLWTKFYSDSKLENYCIGSTTLDRCRHNQCRFTMDQDELDSADAVVFHGRDLKGDQRIKGYSDSYIDFPKYRYDDQLWIFLMFEAPIHTWIDLTPVNSVFNLTMTYRSDSDIKAPYGRVVPLEVAGGLPKLPSVNFSKPGLVVWSVSNCYQTPSRRNEVVHELRKYVQVDIYGACGSLQCTPYTDVCTSVLECHKFLAPKYKFYLAFENSLCEDYITEKFFNALYVGMVPVVYGYGDYARVAPKGSYIDATAFPTIKSLAAYLSYLDDRPEEYKKYFRWREKYTVSPAYFEDAWCSLCSKLWTLESPTGSSEVGGGGRQRVDNLTAWWFSHSGRPRDSSSAIVDDSVLDGAACVSPLQLKWDTSMFTFYSFLYYPNYAVKMWVMSIINVIAIFILLYCVLRVCCGLSRNGSGAKESRL